MDRKRRQILSDPKESEWDRVERFAENLYDDPARWRCSTRLTEPVTETDVKVKGMALIALAILAGSTKIALAIRSRGG